MVTLNALEKEFPGQACLKEFPIDIGPICLHGSLEDRLPKHVRDEIRKRDPEHMSGPLTLLEKNMMTCGHTCAVKLPTFTRVQSRLHALSIHVDKEGVH